MIDLTVIILTKNEERNLRKCVESFKGIAKRFVVVDSYSTDGTEKLCTELNNELILLGSSLDFYQHKWTTYAEQFNWGLDNTNINTTWSMRMDADEELTEELAVEMQKKLSQIAATVNGIILRRRVYFLGRWIKHGGRYPEYLLRVFRTGKAMCEMTYMDEHMVLRDGDTVKFKYDIIDNNQKSIEWWTEKHNWYSNREVFDYQMKMGKNGRSVLESDEALEGQAKVKRTIKNKGYYKLPKFARAHLYFVYRYYFRLGFLDGQEGRIFHFLQAYWYRFLVDAKMFECEKRGENMKMQEDLKV